MKKISLDEEIRINPDEPYDKLMANYLMNNYNQSMVSKAVLQLDRYDMTCQRCSTEYQKYIEDAYIQLTCEAEEEGKPPRRLERLLDRKYGIVNGENKGR